MATAPTTATAADVQLEHDALALSRLWLDPRRPLAQASEEAEVLEAAAQARGDPRTASLSLAFQALHLWTFSFGRAVVWAEIDVIVVRLREVGWRRAVELAEAAWALGQTRQAQPDPVASGLLLAHDGPGAEARPAIERVWTAMALSSLCSIQADHDQALVMATKAEELAHEAGNDFAIIGAVQALAFMFLSVGDVEGAASVLPLGLAAAQRCGVVSQALHYNQLLALVVTRRHADAAQHLVQVPTLLSEACFIKVNALPALVALIWAHSGRAEDAAAILARSAQAPSSVSHTVDANRIWMRAAAHLALGHHNLARAEVETCLAQLLATGAVLSPLNGTHLYRTLSEACEACGDFHASLDALKRSQACCYQWVSASVRSRLNVLHRAVNGADNEQQSRRLAAVSQAATRAEQDSAADNLQRQRRYLQQVTHEMRNPLSGIIGMTSLVMMSDLDESQRRHLGMAQMSAQMLLALCNDVLDMAKLEAGKFELHLQPVDVAQVLQAAADVFRPLSEAQGLALNCHVDPALPRLLRCDKLRLQQVLMNLLSNACKFTRSGSIDVTADWRASAGGPPCLHVRVRDTGPGLNEAAMSRLFQEFSQADASVAHTHGGTGLGLALCRSLVTLMGGDIGADSAPRHGSTFWFSIPISPP